MDAILRRERPKRDVGKAILHALGQWEGLLACLTRGEVPIDTNGVEAAICLSRRLTAPSPFGQPDGWLSQPFAKGIGCPCALGKRNDLFMAPCTPASAPRTFTPCSAAACAAESTGAPTSSGSLHSSPPPRTTPLPNSTRQPTRPARRAKAPPSARPSLPATPAQAQALSLHRLGRFKRLRTFFAEMKPIRPGPACRLRF